MAVQIECRNLILHSSLPSYFSSSFTYCISTPAQWIFSDGSRFTCVTNNINGSFIHFSTASEPCQCDSKHNTRAPVLAHLNEMQPLLVISFLTGLTICAKCFIFHNGKFTYLHWGGVVKNGKIIHPKWLSWHLETDSHHIVPSDNAYPTAVWHNVQINNADDWKTGFNDSIFPHVLWLALTSQKSGSVVF